MTGCARRTTLRFSGWFTAEILRASLSDALRMTGSGAADTIGWRTNLSDTQSWVIHTPWKATLVLG